MSEHEKWMSLAFAEAEKAYEKGEVPVGAVVVSENRIIGRGHNLIETLQDPTAHAEMLAITAAANHFASWRLEDTALYVTLEPCPMCAGAILLARIDSVYYGAQDPRLGACGTTLNLCNNAALDLSAPVTGGILEEKCRAILQEFFTRIRNKN
ncbi:MAG: tRNA adenosine(34) deaminase TadA [candidate division KSB1 bacterium]|jgi:tRNA(adenine34) deaminase|nr:tRNA adenosine(34) deaminase TadA [candidate division KSB1 bacterium]